ncbi:MAG: tetratricopeptide repeat protein [Bacteroidia bacterium]|nr:tetratricopeptide repeat protein [Bacteroidia bacterium]
MQYSIKILKIVPILIFSGVLILTSCNIFHKTVKSPESEISEKTWLEYNNFLVEGNKQKMLGNADECALLYQNCIKLNPENPVPYFELANLYLSQGDWVKALKFSEQSVRLEPKNMWYKIQLANIYQKNGKLMKSAAIFKELIRQYPDRADFYYNLSSLYSAVGKTKEAIKILNVYEKKFGVTEPVSLEKERLYNLLGRTDKSLAEIENLVKAFPKEARYYGILAETYAGNQKFDKALETYKKLLEIDRNNGLVHLSLADFYRVTNDIEKSFDELKLAFASQDVDVDLKVRMLMNFINYTETDEDLNKKAYGLLEILIKAHPEDPKVHTMYADYLIKDKKYAEARDELRFVVKTTKDKYMIWEQLLFLESQLSDYKNLLEESKEALDIFPIQPSAYLFNGLASYELKDYNACIDVLKKGVALVVDDPSLKQQFYTYLGEAYYKNKQYKESDDAFDKLLKLDPNNVVILNNYSYYLSLRSDSLLKAERMIRRVIDLEPNNPTYLDTYAWVLYKLNKLDEAKKYMEQALEKGSAKSAVLVEHYGDIIYKLGDTEKALSQWKKAIELGKGSEFLEQKIKERKLIE